MVVNKGYYISIEWGKLSLNLQISLLLGVSSFIKLCKFLLSVSEWIREFLLHWAAYAAKKGLLQTVCNRALMLELFPSVLQIPLVFCIGTTYIIHNHSWHHLLGGIGQSLHVYLWKGNTCVSPRLPFALVSQRYVNNHSHACKPEMVNINKSPNIWKTSVT